MGRFISFIAVIVVGIAIAFGAGTYSFNYMVEFYRGLGDVEIGSWKAYPVAGTPDADLYARARMKKYGFVTLGYGEGVTFQAWYDDRGRPFNPHCSYEIKGRLPEARFFTLYTVGDDMVPLKAAEGTPFELHSRRVLYETDGSLTLILAPSARAGNWLATSGDKPYGVFLTFYDSPVASTSGLHQTTLPTIRMIEKRNKDCG